MATATLNSPSSETDLWQRLQRFFRKKSVQGYLFIMPWFIGFILFGVYPLSSTIYNSFTNYDLFDTPQWIGLKNYIQIFTKDPIFVQISWQMLAYVTLSTAITVGLGLLFAVLLNRSFPGNRIFRVIIYVPSLLVGVATGTMFKQVFDSSSIGLANTVLGWAHLGPVNFLSDYNNIWHSQLALISVNFWYTGGTMLIFLAGLKGIAPAYYEAAQLDGAGPFTIFRRITIPLLSPVIVLNTILVLIGHIQVFDTPITFAVGGGGLTVSDPLGYKYSLGTWVVYIYKQGFQEFNFGYASALSVVVFLVTLLLSLGVIWLSRRNTYYDALQRN